MSGGITEVDAVVVGAGFAGLYMVHRLHNDGWAVKGFEAGSGVGGTWFWNRYPGARCDVESIDYSYSFDDALQQEWEWSERYAPQPEILRYLEHVAERFDLRRHFAFETRVTAATFDEAGSRWTVRAESAAGDVEEVSARFVVMATGCLSSANMPDIPGAADFAGETLHTGRWPHDGRDFTGQRVAVIGTGSSAIQSIPLIAEQADVLVVFQRTATYSVPAHNRAFEPGELATFKARYGEIREANRASGAGFGNRITPPEKAALEVDADERSRTFEERWEMGGLPFLAAFTDVLLDPNANATAADFVRAKVGAIVEDPETAAKLSPTQVIGCKRLCVDTGYYATYNRPNVRLVDLGDQPIERITSAGIRAGGEDFAFDTIVFATGFDAMTGALDRIAVTGKDGRTLKEAWSEGPRTYLGLGVPGFPNLFLVTGPGSPSVLTNMVVSIEQHVEWIAECVAHLRDHGHTSIEASSPSADEWVAYVNTVASFTLFPTCNSWYLGANIPGKPRVFMPLPGFALYAEQCASVVSDHYRGFEFVD